MVKLGLMTKIDKAALAIYCQAWARWGEAEAMVKEVQGWAKGAEYHKALRAWRKEAADAMRDLMRYLVEFGMTPSSRSRVRAEAPPKEGDELEKWLGKRGSGSS